MKLKKMSDDDFAQYMYEKYFKPIKQNKIKELTNRVWDYTVNGLKRYTITVNGKDKKIIFARNEDEAKNKILETIGVNIDDVFSGKISRYDIWFELYNYDPFKINVVDKRNILEVEFEVIEE